MITRALIYRILYPVRINSVYDQFLLYLSSISGISKTYLIKAFMFSLSVLRKHSDILLTASTGAAAANIGSATYYSAL
jgi:hypothetical protein